MSFWISATLSSKKRRQSASAPGGSAAPRVSFKASILAMARSTAWAAAPDEAVDDDAKSAIGFEERWKDSKAAWRHGSGRGGANDDDAGSPPHLRTRREDRGATEAGESDDQAASNPGAKASAERDAASSGASPSSSPEDSAAARREPDEEREHAAMGPAP